MQILLDVPGGQNNLVNEGLRQGILKLDSFHIGKVAVSEKLTP